MASRRRQRYTVGFPNGERKVILAYSGAGAAEHFKGQGPLAIQKGDYRMKLNPDGGWRLKDGALELAIRELGLKWPVDIAPNAREGNTSGNYILAHGSCAPQRRSYLWVWAYYHRIMVKRYLTPQEASETLWHELAHALQAERCGSWEPWERYQIHQRRNFNYSDRPMEVEARALAKRFSGVLLCD